MPGTVLNAAHTNKKTVLALKELQSHGEKTTNKRVLKGREKVPWGHCQEVHLGKKPGDD